MFDAILRAFQASDYNFRTIANPQDPLAAKFSAWEDYYRLKWAIARVLKPQRILEIGVRYGYSAHAFLAAVPDSRYLGIDLDCEVAGGVKGAIDWAKQILQPFDAEFLVADSQLMPVFPGDRYDLIHVDGRQDGDSSFHDLSLALQQSSYVLVDGYHWSLQNFLAVSDFLLQHRHHLAWYGLIPGYAGELLIKVKSAPVGTDGDGLPSNSKPPHSMLLNAGQPQPSQTSEDLRAKYDKTYYTQSCHGYESFVHHQGQRLEDERLIGAATLACLKPQGQVLDLGCGRGELALHLAQRGYQVTAIDYSEAAIELAQACAQADPNLGQRITFHCADVNQIELPLATYDLVIATDLIEHLNSTEVEILYRRIRQWLKPDGLLIVHTFPNLWYYQYDYGRKRRLARRLGAYLPRNPRTNYEKLMHINEQSPRVLKRQLVDVFTHQQLWFATAGPQGLGGSLTRSFTHRELAAAPSLYAIASAQPLPELHPLLTSRPIRWWQARQLRQSLMLTIVDAPPTTLAAQPFEIQVQLVNQSSQMFHSLGDYPIHLSYRWFDQQGQVCVVSRERTRIFPPLLPQRQQKTPPATAYYVRIIPPDQFGVYLLQVTLVQEQVRWFDDSPIGLRQNCLITVTA